jgi:hypothetical protein
MKKLSYFKKIVALAVLAALALPPAASRASISDIFKGWGWNSVNTGWISLNATNTNNTAHDFGVTFDEAKNITGYAWSDHLGWICFGSTCLGDPPGAPTTGWATYDNSVSPPQLRGWARVYSLYTLTPSGQEGWISLNCSNSSVCGTSNYNVNVDVSNGQLHGYGWNCTTVSGSGSCDGANYSGGLGWVRFDPIYTPSNPGDQKSFIGVPWLQVLYGDLYSKGNINTPSPFTTVYNKANASFCVDKGTSATIQHFQGTSTSCASGSLSIDINAPKSGSNYSNVLGRIKLRGYNDNLTLTSAQRTVLQSGKYGPWTQVGDLAGSIPAILGGGIYDTYTAGTWTMSARTFNNALGSNSGAGLIIVRGNLNITGDIAYQGTTITNLKQLASVGILVLDDGSGTMGNINIDPAVRSIVGNIYAEGAISTGTTGNSLTEKPLTVNGVVVAKKFNLQRQYPGDNSTPSEQILYDGRIVANTPPGLNNFAASLPVVGY